MQNETRFSREAERYYHELSCEEDAIRTNVHYMLPPRFFEVLTGGRWHVYSCNVWPKEGTVTADDDAAQTRSQEAKLDLLARVARLRPGMRVLDVGCGWGGPLLYWEQRHRIAGTGLTLSPAQAGYAAAWAERLGSKCRFEICHWDRFRAEEPMDAILTDEVSVHFQRLEDYFERAFALVADGGVVVNKELHFTHPRHAVKLPAGASFINQLYGITGNYRCLADELAMAHRAGFEVADVVQLEAADYVHTAGAWRANLKRHQEELVALVGMDTFRNFCSYLSLVVALFEGRAAPSTQTIDVVTYRKPAPRQSTPARPGRARESESTEALEAEVTRETAAFSERVATAASVAAIEVAYGELLGSPAVQAARARAADADASRALRAAAVRGLERFHEICGTARHAMTRPFGYPGDYAILELAYDRRPHPDSRTAAGHLADAWFASSPLSRALAARKDLLAAVLEERAFSAVRPLRILSLAAGAARELREMSPGVLERVDATLLDLDPRPLDFARASLAAVAPSHRVRTVVGNAIAGGDVVGEVGTCGPYDVIYSFGLFDYLEDQPLLRTARNFLPLLAEKGQMIFCLKDRRYYDWLPADWLYNWRFVPRTADDGPRLAGALDLRTTRTWLVGDRCIAAWACERSA